MVYVHVMSSSISSNKIELDFSCCGFQSIILSPPLAYKISLRFNMFLSFTFSILSICVYSGIFNVSKSGFKFYSTASSEIVQSTSFQNKLVTNSTSCLGKYYCASEVHALVLQKHISFSLVPGHSSPWMHSLLYCVAWIGVELGLGCLYLITMQLELIAAKKPKPRKRVAGFRT